MLQITSEKSLKSAILDLEAKQAETLVELKAHFYIAFDSLQPINLIKSTFQEVVATPELKRRIVSGLIGFSVAYISQKLFERALGKFNKRLLNTALYVAESAFFK